MCLQLQVASAFAFQDSIKHIFLILYLTNMSTHLYLIIIIKKNPLIVYSQFQGMVSAHTCVATVVIEWTYVCSVCTVWSYVCTVCTVRTVLLVSSSSKP